MEVLTWAHKKEKPSPGIQCTFYLHLGKDSYPLPCNICNMDLFSGTLKKGGSVVQKADVVGLNLGPTHTPY